MENDAGEMTRPRLRVRNSRSAICVCTRFGRERVNQLVQGGEQEPGTSILRVPRALEPMGQRRGETTARPVEATGAGL